MQKSNKRVIFMYLLFIFSVIILYRMRENLFLFLLSLIKSVAVLFYLT